MMDLLYTLTGWIRPYNSQVALALVATLLVIFGDRINGSVRRLVRRYWVVVRVAAFIALCTFGYGALTVWIVPILARGLLHIPGQWYGLTITVGFIVLGVMAERFQKGN
ncbi:DUF3392 family protein [Oceanobacter mangrovi]|uniref:DUF3392 family protein n=1 Tax=Oceanobacter mangrovi TaxID=2862510 RepID=UPI001FE486E6|nr:DUF3392 family protein [Oceanobacter mangrovi]